MSDNELMEKAEMYIGRMTMLENEKSKDIKKWFSCSLNIYNILMTLKKRFDISDLDFMKGFNTNLN